MKKNLLLLLSTTALLALSSCGGNNPAPEANSSVEAPSTASSEASMASSGPETTAASSFSDEDSTTGSSEEDASTQDSLSEGSSVEEASSDVDSSISSSEAESMEESVAESVEESKEESAEESIGSSSEQESLDDSGEDSSQQSNLRLISIQEDPLLDIVAPGQAEVGESVTVRVQPKEENVVDVTYVLYNDSYATFVKDGEWSFTMPDADVVLSVETTPVLEHTVSLSDMVDSSIVALTGERFSAKRGSAMSFSVELRNEGYEVTAVRFAGTDTNLFDPASNTVAFTMPDEDVTLMIDVQGRLFALALEDADLPVSITADSMALIEGKARYGSSVSLSCDSSDLYFRTHRPIAFVEVGSDPEVRHEVKNGAAHFTMPAHDVTLRLLSEEITYGFSLVPSDHIGLGAYAKKGEEYVAMDSLKAMEGQEIYIGTENKDPDTYGLSELVVTYETNNYYNPEGRIDLLDGSHEEGAYYHFTFPGDLKEGTTLTVTASERGIAYLNEKFLGSYMGVNIVSDNYSSAIFSGFYSISIDATGAVKDAYGDEMGRLGGKTDQGFTYLHGEEETSNDVLYQDGLYIAPGSFQGGSIGPDIAVGIQKLSPTDSSEDYAVRFERFLGDTYVVAQFFHKNAKNEWDNAANLFYDGVNKTLRTDVSFQFSQGVYVSDYQAAYDIVAEGKTLLGVYTDGSGTLARRVLDGNQGDYAGVLNEQKTTIHVDGKGKLIFGDEDTYHDYLIDEEGRLIVEIVRDDGTYTYAFTLDKDEGTFTVSVDFEPKPSEELAFVGHTYRRQAERNALELAFKKDGVVDGTAYNSKGKVWNDCCFPNATYAVDGTTVTISATSTYSGSGTLTLSYDASNDKFVVTAKSGSLFGSDGISVPVNGTFTLKA